MTVRLRVVLALLVLHPVAGAAQDLVPYRFAANPPTIDGRLTDDEWNRVTPLPLVNLYPSFQSPPSERTEIRVGYDADYFYASIRAWDSDPSGIRATTLYRDRWESDEEFAVILDTFSDGQSAAMFLVTPTGVRVDNQLTYDAEPGRGEWMNRDWNVPWSAAGMRLADGWSAEMRVPFSSLRFAVVDGRVAMRLKTYRYLPRKGENQIYPATRPDGGTQPHFKPSLGQPVVFHDIRAVVPVYVQPYVAGTSASRGDDRAEFDAGLDVKLSPTRSTTVDLTVNTDFAQVEVDQLQVNLTRFPLRFPERRPFFLERAGLFAVGLGGNDTLFHSRRVGLDDDGVPRPVLGGARVVGRLGGWDAGAMSVQVGGDASENASVLRAQRVTGGGHSFGLSTTTRAGDAGTAVAGAGDASFALGRRRLSTVWAASSGGGSLLERSRGAIGIQQGSEQGMSYQGEYRFTGRDFAPPLAFVRLTDAHEFDGALRQSWRPTGGTPIRRHGWELLGAGRWRRADGVMEDARITARWNAVTTDGLSGNAQVQVGEEDVPVAFDVGPGATITPGRYRSTTGRVSMGTPPSALQVFGAFEAGGFFGGRRRSWRLEPVWTPSPHFQGWVIVDQTRLSRGPAGDASIDLVVVGARAALNTHVFADLNVQRTSGSRAIGQLRFRWNLAEGHDLWVVAERGRSSDGQRRHAVTVKYARLLALGGAS